MPFDFSGAFIMGVLKHIFDMLHFYSVETNGEKSYWIRPDTDPPEIIDGGNTLKLTLFVPTVPGALWAEANLGKALDQFKSSVVWQAEIDEKSQG